jgi:hypothetical protein
MAVITLKDLMDPLTKLAAATEKTAQKLDAVISVVTGGSGSSLNQEIVKELQTQTNLLRTIAGNTKGGSGIKVDGKPVNKDKLKEGAEAIKMLGGGASSLAFGLMAFMLVPKGVIKKFTATIEELMAAFDKLDPKKVEKGAKSFEIIAGSIGKFAKGLAIAGILFIPAMIGVGLIHIALKILMPTFEMIGDSEKNVQKGAEVLDLMGGALIKFAKGLVLAAIGATIGILFTPVIVLSMILVGGAFALIGKMNTPINDGTNTIDKIGKGLIFFSIGLVTFALATMFILTKPIIVAAMVGTLVLIGGAFALLGIFDKSIKKGAVALFAVGLSLVAFSIGYLIFAATTKDMTLEQVGIQAAVLLGVGLVTGLIGKGFMSVVKGAIGIAAMGLGLIVFSLGYLPFATVTKDMTMENVGLQLGLLLGLGLEFAAAGLGAPFILAGAAAFAAVGGAFLLLAPGLNAIKAVDFTQEDSIKLTTMLSGIKSAFLGNDGADEGFFSKIGGALTGAVDSVRMLEAAAGFAAAGGSLTILSKGLTSFKNIQWNDELSKELVTMLSGVTTAFALGAGEQVPSTSFFGQVFGFKSTKVAEGIQSVKGAGKALIDIVKGLDAFQSMVDKNINWDSLGSAIIKSVGFVQDAFSKIASEGNVDAGGFFGSLLGIKKNKVAEGITSVQGAGKELTNIVTGLMSFQEMVEQKINWDNLGLAISKSVGFVQSAFAAIGGEENVEAGGFFGSLLGIKKNKVAEGITSVKGAGKELTNIAAGLKSFQEMINKEVNFDDLGLAIKNSISLIGEAFAIIGGKEQSDSAFFGLMKWDENLVKKGIDNVKGAGAELTSIATGLQTFAQLKDPQAVANSIKTLFTSIGDTFTLYYEKPKFKGQLDHMKGFVTEISNNAKNGYLDKAAKGMNDIAKAVNSIDSTKAESFANLFKGAGELTNNQNAFQALLNAVEDIREALAGTAAPNVTATVPVAGAQPAATTTSGLTPVLNNINAALARLNGTMTGLPAAISSIKIVIPD